MQMFFNLTHKSCQVYRLKVILFKVVVHLLSSCDLRDLTCVPNWFSFFQMIELALEGLVSLVAVSFQNDICYILVCYSIVCGLNTEV